MTAKKIAPALIALLLGVAFLFVSTSVAQAAPTKMCGKYSSNQRLSRGQVISRAQSWLNKVPYNQNACYSNSNGNYRTDCSGYVSMAWGLSYSRTTADIRGVTNNISRGSLAPGDALWHRSGGFNHVALFVKWGNGGQAWVYEEYNTGHKAEQRLWKASQVNSFTPIRYGNIY
ncbi:NlpC/P60 family protein [Fodinicola feengrottensis]|uniref:CHAP domain-containing protein n=1 Tax=Fodinicola feengrottensis TaxID=435914 RepID=A0ABP4TCP7_9ACTN|nr:hypothetical protein [Fodinicola feengrottensis]